MFIYLITPENPHEHPVITAVAFEDDIINYFTALTEVNRDTVDAHHYAVYRMAVFIYRYYESKRYDVGVYDQTPSREFSNFLTAQNANHTVYYQIVHFNGLEKPAQLLKRFLGETRSYDSFTPFMVDNMDNVFLRKKHLILNPEVMKDINKKYKQYTKKKDKTAIVVYSNSPHYLKLAAQGKRFPTIGEHFRCMQSYQYPGCTFDNPYTPKDLLPVGSSVPQMATNSWTPVIAGAAFVGVLGFGLYKAYRYFYPAQKSLKKPKETKETKETKEVPAKTTRKKVSRRGSETSAIEDSTESYPVPDEKTINWEELEQKYATIYRKTKEMLISNAKYSAAKNILDKTEVALKEIDNTYRKTKKTKENFKKISQLVIRLQELNNQSRQELSELRNDLTTLHKDRIDKSNRYLTREYWGLSAAPADEKKETPVAPSQKTVFTASDLKAAT
ncbi:MAG TPA: hypothetical protein VHM20_08910, partial [Gammaproteobacteria bacterium]|nr:hypothetical protein [Gammaproteobacteria bacterium]